MNADGKIAGDGGGNWDWRSPEIWRILTMVAPLTVLLVGVGAALPAYLGVNTGQEAKVWGLIGLSCGYALAYGAAWMIIRRYRHDTPHVESDGPIGNAEEFTAADFAKEIERIRAGTPVWSGRGVTNITVGGYTLIALVLMIFIFTIQFGSYFLSESIYSMQGVRAPDMLVSLLVIPGFMPMPLPAAFAARREG